MKRKLYRKVSADPFVRIPNKTVRESNLSPEALGVLVYLLSHSEEYDHWRNKLMDDFNIKMHKYQRIMRELEIAGFILRTTGGATAGKKGGANLYVTDVKDGLIDVRKNRTSKNHDVVKISTHKKKKYLRDKNIKKTDPAKNADGRSRTEHQANIEQDRYGVLSAAEALNPEDCKSLFRENINLLISKMTVTNK